MTQYVPELELFSWSTGGSVGTETAALGFAKERMSVVKESISSQSLLRVVSDCGVSECFSRVVASAGATE